MACIQQHVFMLVAVICGLLGTSQAYPQYWVGGGAGISPACYQHPNASLFPVASRPDTPHQAVQTDASASISLLKGGVPVSPSAAGLCPGETYQLQLAFSNPDDGGAPYLFYVTTSAGELAAAFSPSCKNQYFSPTMADKTRQWSSNLTLPCDAQGQLVVKVTCTYQPGGSMLHQTTQNTAISTACAAAACSSSGGGTSNQPTPAGAVLNRAVSGSNRIVDMHDTQGGLTLNLDTGAATMTDLETTSKAKHAAESKLDKLKEPFAKLEATTTALRNSQQSTARKLVEQQVDSTTLKRIKTHGILMTIGWVGLLPLGTLLPRHRWALGEAKVFGTHVWFQLHLLLQVCGFAIMTAGIACAWTWFDDSEVLDNGIGRAHKVLGVITFSLAVSQLVGGFTRPKVDAPGRRIFNLLHHWLGRLVIVIAWVTVYLGIAVFHKSSYPMQLASWIGPVAAVMGAIVLLDVVLTLVAYRSNKPLGAAGLKCYESAPALHLCSGQC